MTKDRTRRTLFDVAGVVLIGVIGLSLSLTGSPSYNRKRRFDEERLRDLQTIHTQVEAYRKVFKGPPPNILSLKERRGEYFGYHIEDKDPETGLPYRFEPLAKGEYRLCATFALELKEEETRNVGWGFSRMWAHPAGEHCFRFE